MKTKKAQMEIQEMAFVLLAVVILGAILFLIYARMQSSSIVEQASEIQEKKALSQIAIISSMPELSCSQSFSPAFGAGQIAICIDEDKLIEFKKISSKYKWQGLSKIQIQRIYPAGTGECIEGNFVERNCATYTILDTGKANTTISSFASLCRQEKDYLNCQIAKILVSTTALT